MQNTLLLKSDIDIALAERLANTVIPCPPWATPVAQLTLHSPLNLTRLTFLIQIRFIGIKLIHQNKRDRGKHVTLGLMHPFLFFFLSTKMKE